jgi:uncharacterized protein (DUF1015 family)
MEGGGFIRGHAVRDDRALARIAEGLGALADPARFARKYDVPDAPVLLYAMGDGNHSLAAAKGHWDNVRRALSPEARASHPARHALVELVNVHDEGLVFEPIHRVVFDVDPEALLSRAPAYFGKQGGGATVEELPTPEAQRERLEALWKAKDGRHAVGYVSSGRRGVLVIDRPTSNLEVGSLQVFLDDDLAGSKSTIDYIHGHDVVESLSAEPRRIGFLLPPMDKSELFKTVIVDGALPRKTFSMGEADEKRYYLEARRIVP